MDDKCFIFGSAGSELEYNCLYIGPNNIPHLFNILVKFRSHAVGLVADIEKEFLMVGIDHVDRDMLRFLWVKNIQEPIPEIIEFRFTRLVFGLRPSLVVSIYVSGLPIRILLLKL